MLFDPQKALDTLQSYITITHEHSPFEWVGSHGAITCVIILIQGLDSSNKKVAACAHISGSEAGNPLEFMLQTSGITKLLKAHLVSAGVCEDDDQMTSPILKALNTRKVPTTYSLGAGVDKAAIHVKTGECSSQIKFSFKNSGFKTKQEEDLYIDRFEQESLKSLFQSFKGGDIQPRRLQVSMDMRKPEDQKRMLELLPQSVPLVLPSSSLPFAAAASASGHKEVSKKEDNKNNFGGMRKGFLL